MAQAAVDLVKEVVVVIIRPVICQELLTCLDCAQRVHADGAVFIVSKLHIRLLITVVDVARGNGLILLNCCLACSTDAERASLRGSSPRKEAVQFLHV